MGGVAERNFPGETYYAQLRCHEPWGDDYHLTFTRKTAVRAHWREAGGFSVPHSIFLSTGA